MDDKEWEFLCNARMKIIEVRLDEGDRRMDELKAEQVVTSGKIDKILFTGITSVVLVLTTLLVIIFKG